VCGGRRCLAGRLREPMGLVNASLGRRDAAG